MNNKPNIVFLYSEIAGYFLASVKELAKHANVLIVRWEVNKEAPFKFDIPKGIEVRVKSDFSVENLSKKAHDFNPDIIVCSGWMDKEYLKIVKSFKKQIPTVLTLDNHWTGSLKQRVASVLSPFLFTNKFTHAWVPGLPQKQFAQKLGFKNNILIGFYCADVALYNKIHNNQSNQINSNQVKKQFLYVGRYVKHKGIFEMWQAFIELQNENPNEWEMLCVGTGDEWENRLTHSTIKHLGFVQPSEMEQFLLQKSVYILPSKFEPWGVTVQEFAITSCPLILSKHVGSSEQFLKDNQNGVLINEVSVESLKKAMQTIMAKPEDELILMSEKSHELGMSYTSKMWVERLLGLIK